MNGGGDSVADDAIIGALTDEELREIDAEIAHAPYRNAVAIDALKIVQAHRGWVSDASLQALASHLGMSSAELDSIATFYNLIYRKPVGEQVILLCNSISCWIKGCDQLQQQIGERLGIGPGETSPDDRFTLLPVGCLGACDKAPVMIVGEQLHENVDSKAIEDLLASSAGSSGESSTNAEPER